MKIGTETPSWSFGLVANQGLKDKDLLPIFDKLEHLVCDDQGSESCDFIAVTKARVSMIHAKATRDKEDEGGKKSKTSKKASGHSRFGIKHIGEVIIQANKNLGHLNALEPKEPKLVKRWGKDDWKESKGNAKVASINRIVFTQCKKNLKGKEFWDTHVLPEIKRPSIEKYAVCIISNGFSRGTFIKHLQDPTHGNYTEAVYAYYLILNLVGAAQQLGIKVEVYCDE